MGSALLVKSCGVLWYVFITSYNAKQFGEGGMIVCVKETSQLKLFKSF
jgi:hypothetical protein